MQFLFGLIVTGLGIVCRKFYKLYKNEKQHQKTKEQKEFYTGLEDLIKINSKEIKEVKDELKQDIKVVKDGVLSVQKRNFEQQCHELLQEDHEITLAEFEHIQEEHKTYNSLGGNHDGDVIYNIIVQKASKNIID